MESTESTSESDAEFRRLLAQLSAPTSDAVPVPPPPPPSRAAAPSVAPVSPAPSSGTPRLPELMGADALAAAPPPFPPAPVESTPLVEPTPPAPTTAPPWETFAPPVTTPAAPPAAPPAMPPSASPAMAPAAVPPATPTGMTTAAGLPVLRPTPPVSNLDFSAILSASGTPASAGIGAATPLLVGSPTGSAEEPDIARSTAGERISLILAILLPPIGLVTSVIGAILSSRRRGWVIGVLKAGISIGAVLSVVAGIGGSIGYTLYEQQQQHYAVAEASTAFCATIKATPSMIEKPDFGWPAVAASIPDSLTAMQTYQTRWANLAKVSPDGIKADVTKVSTAAKQIIDSVTAARTVNDASNIAVMTSVASASRVPAWYAEYCS